MSKKTQAKEPAKQTQKRRQSIFAGLTSLFHVTINAILPGVLLLLVVRELTTIAALILLLSKWRTIAIRPRYWAANIRANMVDIIVGFATLLFMHDANRLAVSDTKFIFVVAAWAAWYGAWLLFIKPRSSEFMVSIQAFASLSLGTAALFLYSDSIPDFLLILVAGVIGAASARHYLSSFEEPFIGSISMIWGFFVAQLAWLLNRWLIVYDIGDIIRLPQITLLVSLAGYSFAELYHLTKQNKLTKRRRNQIVSFGIAIMVIVVVVSDWSQNI